MPRILCVLISTPVLSYFIVNIFHWDVTFIYFKMMMKK